MFARLSVIRDTTFNIQAQVQGFVRFNRKKRAISYIMEVVMMTLVVTALATVVLTWGLGAVTDSKTALASAMNARMGRLQEGVVVEDMQMLSSSSVRLWVRNTGSIQVVVDQIYIANVNTPITGVCPPGTNPAPNCPTTTTKLSLAAQAVGAVDVTLIPASVTGTPSQGAPACAPGTPICAQYSYIVIASTNRGTTFQGSFTV